MPFFARGVKLESATVPYVHRIAVAFFGNLVDTSVEFRKAFAGLPAMSSSFLTWLEEEVNLYTKYAMGFNYHDKH